MSVNSLRESASESMNRAIEIIGLNRPTPSVSDDASQDSALDELSGFCPALTYQQRITGMYLCVRG